MSVLVTGGTGYIGSHTVVELINAGYDVVIIDNLSNSSEKVLGRIEKITGKTPKFYKCDIRDSKMLDTVFENENIDVVIHFAGLKAVGESVSKPLMYYDNNIGGSVKLFDAMQRHDCKKIVFSSSATVYGSLSKPPFKEDSPVGMTTNPYGTTKLYIEKIFQDLYYSDNEFSISILRYFNPIGAHESGEIGEDPHGIPNNVMPYIAQVATGKLPIFNIFGDKYPTRDGTGVRDYIHVVDLALGHLKAMDRVFSKTGVDIYNLGTGKGYSVLELLTAFEEASGKEIPRRVVGPREGDIAESYADPTKAEKELGWKAERDLKKMCEDTWRWQSKNPNGYEE